MLSARPASNLCLAFALAAILGLGFGLQAWPLAIGAVASLILTSALFEALHQIIEHLRGIQSVLRQTGDKAPR